MGRVWPVKPSTLTLLFEQHSQTPAALGFASFSLISTEASRGFASKKAGLPAFVGTLANMEITTISLVYPMSRTAQDPDSGERMVGAAVLGLLNKNLAVRVLVSGVGGHCHIVNRA
jgi:hypothetical protein